MSDVEERAGDERSGREAPRRDAPDESGYPTPDIAGAVEVAINARDRAALEGFTRDLHEADLAALIEAIEPACRSELITLLGRDFDFAALTEVDGNIREEILADLPNAAVAHYVRDLESDDAVTLLETLDGADRDEVLRALPAVDRAMLQRSLQFPEGSAGRLMQTTVVTLPPFWTAGQAIDMLRDAAADDLPDQFYEVFVVDPTHRLLGNVFLDALMRSTPDRHLGVIMRLDRRRVSTTDGVEDVAELFERYNLVSAPVVDATERLVGVITIDDVVDVIREKADQEIRALGGVGADEILSDRVLSIARGRFLWLFVNLVTAFIASSVLGAFQGQLEKMVALAVLAPIVASQGGNGATQTMTVVIRALATRELSRSNAVRVIGREMLVGALNGLAFGVITGFGASLWFHRGGLGIVIAAAMLTNLVAGALGGILVPLALEYLEIDPAVSSSAFVTTVTDVVGYSSFLGFATFWYHLS